ncbi:Z1 domain-containing protein [Sulfurovum sp. NBC37-1]|uniref:Z1 domain-containing protein n=1 Tax=Sulfurovum sp. (strain NBC37-1) TaxID=387093 RepID=UPI0001587B46|nr:Z1 domain-containing protein [Sulfurovum sp. NBC37-1]BAF73365.1 endonuclease [Sulfurovum sp. NBC37-1]
MEIIEKITNDVIYKLSQQPENKTPETIRQLIAFESSNPLEPVILTSDQIEHIAKEVEHQFGLTMEEGTLIVDDENFEPWLHNKKSSENFEPYFWNRYETLLLQNGFAPPVVSSIDNVTNKIVARLEDPDKEGPWDRRGMVVGHVQSGKTANFIGVVNKASDVGYELIVILAGMQETLRSQTQERVDEGYIGQDSSKKNSVDFAESLIGVGNLNHDKIPYSFTTKHKDFDDRSNFVVKKYDDATVLVVKKNARVLEKLRDWLKKNNSSIDGTISNLPLLLIDDEADHASVNTNDSDKDPTTINKRIREILNLFHRKCYLAYTATPFANIFIDPSSEDDMYKDNLFPKDFIISLDPPSNYVGSEKIFGNDDEAIDIVRDIGDIEDIIPLKHKKDQTISCLPESLKKAVNSHIISKAIRILRGQSNKHHSMLVHLSRYKDVQKEVFDLIVQFRQDIEKGVRYYYKLQKEEALNNPYMADLYSMWENDFAAMYSEWSDIQEKLLEAAASMQVMLINGDSPDSLDYKAYKNGLNVIAVGGDKLSRGLTLEGLATSYFYRSTSMYDTLMQMGRWFGYRDGFADLCRIYLTPMTESYFAHISNAVEELREELKEMFAANLTPKEFGLKVRTHPGSLLITARNKMRASETLLHRTDLSGRLVETYVVDLKPEHRKNNLDLFNEISEKLQKIEKAEYSEASSNNYVWKYVSANIVEEFVKRFDNHPRAQMTQTKPILSYLERASEHFPKWDIVFISSRSSKERYSAANGDIDIGIQKRTCNPKGQYEKDNYIEISTRRRVASGTNDAERAGMAEDEIAEALERWKRERQGKADKEKENGNSEKAKEILEKDLKISSIPGRYLRRARRRPLLMLHLVNAYKDIKDEATLVESQLPAYGISFPKRDDIYIEPVEYAVNTTFVKNYYQEFEDDEE